MTHWVGIYNSSGSCSDPGFAVGKLGGVKNGPSYVAGLGQSLAWLLLYTIVSQRKT